LKNFTKQVKASAKCLKQLEPEVASICESSKKLFIGLLVTGLFLIGTIVAVILIEKGAAQVVSPESRTQYLEKSSQYENPESERPRYKKI